jgi:PAS domain S-box-containing protein
VPGSREQVEEWFTKVRNSGKTETRYGFKLVIKRNGEEMTYWDTNVAPMFDSAGNVDGILILTQDVTEHKRAEEVLQESRQRLQFHIDNSPMATIEWDANFIVTRWAGEAERVFGWRSDETIGKPIMDLHIIYDEDIPIVQKVMERLTDGVSKYVVSTNRNYTKDGKIIYCTWYNSVLLDTQGKMASVMSQVQDITESKQAEEELRLDHAIITNINDGVFLIRVSDGVILFANRQFEKMFGYNPGELIGKHVSVVNAPTEKNPQEAAKEIIDELNKHGIWRGRVLTIKKDGTTFWCDANVTSLKIERPDYGAVWVSVHRDITERVKAEASLRALSSRQKAILAAVPDIIMEVDNNKVYTWANQAGFEFFGKDVIGKEAAFYFEGEQDTYSVVQPLFNGAENVIYVESWQRRKDGQKRLLAWWCRGLKDERGNVTGALASARDITERKSAELKLIESHNLMDYIITHDPNAIAVYDNNLNYIFVSDRYLTDYKVKEKDIIGKHHYEVFPEMPERWKMVHRRVLAGTIERSEEDSFERLDGSVDYNRWECRPWYNSDGSIGGMITYTEVITERKLAEQASKRADDEVRKAKDQLEQLNKHLTQVREDERARISRDLHDELGQSLTALKIDLHRTRDNSDNGSALNEKLDIMLDIVDTTIKNVQRIASELHPAILADLGLTAAIEWYCEEFETRSGINCHADLEEVQLKDSHKNLSLFRILQEALTNVIRHANANMVHVKLTRLGEDICLEINDDGIGIGQEILYANNSLGLIGMRERTKQFNGQIEILSSKNNGTTIRISLPIHS